MDREEKKIQENSCQFVWYIWLNSEDQKLANEISLLIERSLIRACALLCVPSKKSLDIGKIKRTSPRMRRLIG